MKIRKIGLRIRSGWSGPLMHYEVECTIHGKQVDYEHGYTSYVGCPLCLVEEVAKRG